MGLDVFWHDDVLAHDTGAGLFEAGETPLLDVPELHPENANRIRNMKSVLERGPLRELVRWREGRHATDEEILRVHDAEYVGSLQRLAAEGGELLSATTRIGPGSWQAALAAAGCAVEAARSVLAGGGPAYALVRPPGHHAQPAMADGYCFLNNIAIAAEDALSAGAERIAIVDWDVHHGNGTQECFYDRADVLTVSLHEGHGSWGPSHPQTGSPLEQGVGDGAGYNVNVLLPYGSGDAAYTQVLRDLVSPLVDAYRPDLLLVACGQDANQFDPNGRHCVTMRGFHGLGVAARELAERNCDGRIALVQEGGYAPSYSAFCLNATLAGVLGEPLGIDDPLAYLPDDLEAGGLAIRATSSAIGFRWPVLINR
jgi:acetoin utilization deacetylase AcuC-like enzyme